MILDVYPKELKTYIHTKTCTWLFIAASFILAKTWMQPSVDEWINKLVHPDNGMLFSIENK